MCPQELYSGGKDCNILAWVPVRRQPDVEDEGKKVGRFTKEQPSSFFFKIMDSLEFLEWLHPALPVLLKTGMVAYCLNFVNNERSLTNAKPLQGGAQVAVNPAFEDAWSSDED